VRPLLCSPEVCSRRDNQPWFLCGSEMFSYIAECLNPKTQRDSCSVRSDINLWGSSLAPLVRYFKKLQPGDHGGIVDLYEFLSEQAQTDACKKTNSPYTAISAVLYVPTPCVLIEGFRSANEPERRRPANVGEPGPANEVDRPTANVGGRSPRNEARGTRPGISQPKPHSQYPDRLLRP
jgi:hypothetical protein